MKIKNIILDILIKFMIASIIFKLFTLRINVSWIWFAILFLIIGILNLIDVLVYYKKGEMRE